MVDTPGMPTIFFTHSAADFHWPDLAVVLQNDSEEFNQIILQLQIGIFTTVHKSLIKILGVSDYWL